MRVNGFRMKAVAAMFSLTLVGAAGAALAEERTFEGEIVSLDGHANIFTAKAIKPGEPVEMAFHVGRKTEVDVEGSPTLFAELVKGDRVFVTYEVAGSTNAVRRTSRQKTMAKEVTLTGAVTAVDLKKQMLTVKSETNGEELKLHVDPATRLYVGGEETELLFGFHPGDKVTVTYETTNPAKPTIKHVKKAA